MDTWNLFIGLSAEGKIHHSRQHRMALERCFQIGRRRKRHKASTKFKVHDMSCQISTLWDDGFQRLWSIQSSQKFEQSLQNLGSTCHSLESATRAMQRQEAFSRKIRSKVIRLRGNVHIWCIRHALELTQRRGVPPIHCCVYHFRRSPDLDDTILVSTFVLFRSTIY